MAAVIRNRNVFSALETLKKKSASGTDSQISNRNGFSALETLKKKKAGSKDRHVKKPESEVIWVSKPITGKSWADIDDDDDDYLATTEPPQFSWAGLQKDKKKGKKKSSVDLLEKLQESESEDDVEDIKQIPVHSEVAEPVLKKPPTASLVPKNTERQLSKKEIKQKELAELEAVLSELGLSEKDKKIAGQDETKGGLEEKEKGEHCSTDEIKENDAAPLESKTSKKKKTKKEKSAKETKVSEECPGHSVADVPNVCADVDQREGKTSTIDMKEQLKKLAPMKKKKSNKELDAAAKVAGAEAAARSAKLTAAKKKEKTHYNQQRTR